MTRMDNIHRIFFLFRDSHFAVIEQKESSIVKTFGTETKLFCKNMR